MDIREEFDTTDANIEQPPTVNGTWSCGLCDPEFRQNYATRDDLNIHLKTALHLKRAPN